PDELEPRAFAATREKKGATPNRRRAALATGSAERRLADPQPDPQTPNLTGRFEDSASRITMQIIRGGNKVKPTSGKEDGRLSELATSDGSDQNGEEVTV